MSAPLQPQAVPGAVPSPQAELEEEAELSRMREEVMSLAADAMAEGEEHRASFEEYAELWLESPEEFLQHFLTFQSTGEPEAPSHEGPPSLQLFQEEVRGGHGGACARGLPAAGCDCLHPSYRSMRARSCARRCRALPAPWCSGGGCRATAAPSIRCC